MLSPDDRRLYTDALRPPAGYRFGDAVATTYSLDLQTLLTIPLHLALFSAELPMEDLLRDGVALLEALRRTADRLTVYAQSSRISDPVIPHVLYSLLESSVIEVEAPSAAGSFHPKLWLIRFDKPDSDESRLRLLVLSRNITADRCWDLVLTLEGTQGPDAVPANRPLARLLERLPSLAGRAVGDKHRAQTQRLPELALRAKWEMPGHFDEVRFHALGLDGAMSWLPDGSNELAVVSPFLSTTALEKLLGTTHAPVVLVSRPEWLARIPREVLDRFRHVKVLADQAELEGGEEPVGSREADAPRYGLHAKAFITKQGWDTHVYMGSANATNAALVNGTNVELVAELIGKRSRVGGIDDLMSADGVGGLLLDYVPPNEPNAPDSDVERAREALDVARRELGRSGIRIRFADSEDGWIGELTCRGRVSGDGIAAVRAWLVTREDRTATDARALLAGRPVLLQPSLIQHVTSFVVFELIASAADERVRFVLGVEAVEMPVEERDAAVVRDVIRNRDGFLRYVMLLLAEATEDGDVFGTGSASWGRLNGSRTDDDLPLFEHLTRAYCRQPDRLGSIRRLLREIGSEHGDDVVPPEFRDLWDVFERAAAADDGAKP